MRLVYSLRGIRYYPILQITIKEKDKMLKTEALVDSGASISVFKSSIADYFGIDIKSGEKVDLEGANGKFIGYAHDVNMQFGELHFRCKIAFSDELATNINILGRDNFFKFFRITFEEAKKQFISESLLIQKAFQGS